VLSDERFSVCGEEFTVAVGGRHNLYNGLAAYAIGKAAGLSAAQIRKGLMAYVPDGIRQSEKKIRDGVTVICDYYNASPASMMNETPPA
jgi:UDP-N-acetylmuramoyl-tripeptide--D-alanyl-D-alanine ligase